jgi:hypothetical protein
MQYMTIDPYTLQIEKFGHIAPTTVCKCDKLLLRCHRNRFQFDRIVKGKKSRIENLVALFVIIATFVENGLFKIVGAFRSGLKFPPELVFTKPILRIFFIGFPKLLFTVVSLY